MAGTMDIRDGTVWMPAGWIFDNVLEFAAAELRDSDPELATLLLDASTDKGGYLDLRTFSSDQFRMILSAVEIIYERMLDEGPSSFSEPSFYDGFMKHFSNLKTMLQTDDRARRSG